MKVRADGSRIDIHNIGKNQSQKIRQEIERAFRLVPAKRGKWTIKLPVKPVPPDPVAYGRKIRDKKNMDNFEGKWTDLL